MEKKRRLRLFRTILAKCLLNCTTKINVSRFIEIAATENIEFYKNVSLQEHRPDLIYLLCVI